MSELFFSKRQPQHFFKCITVNFKFKLLFLWSATLSLSNSSLKNVYPKNCHLYTWLHCQFYGFISKILSHTIPGRSSIPISSPDSELSVKNKYVMNQFFGPNQDTCDLMRTLKWTSLLHTFSAFHDHNAVSETSGA